MSRQIQVRYVSASTVHKLQDLVNECIDKDSRWKLEGQVTFGDVPDGRHGGCNVPIWIQTLLRYVEPEEFEHEHRH